MMDGLLDRWMGGWMDRQRGTVRRTDGPTADRLTELAILNMVTAWQCGCFCNEVPRPTV